MQITILMTICNVASRMKSPAGMPVIPIEGGADIGCGTCTVQTGFPGDAIDRRQIAQCLQRVKLQVPLAEGHGHRHSQRRERFNELPSNDLAFLDSDSDEGQAYLQKMKFALDYAMENRERRMKIFKVAVYHSCASVIFLREINIHHNYAALEEYFGDKVWVHRKGANFAKSDETGIIPGSMGTTSYIVRGKGHADSFASCSHGTGRTMGRMAASRSLGKEECDKVIEAQRDLIDPAVRLRPLGVLKG